MKPKLTPTQQALATAIDIACSVPLKPSSGTTAYVPWGLLIRLRGELEALGIDWREVKRINDAKHKADVEEASRPLREAEARRKVMPCATCGKPRSDHWSYTEEGTINDHRFAEPVDV